MKKVRRLIGAMLACCMMLTMSVSAFAANVTDEELDMAYRGYSITAEEMDKFVTLDYNSFVEDYGESGLTLEDYVARCVEELEDNESLSAVRQRDVESQAIYREQLMMSTQAQNVEPRASLEKWWHNTSTLPQATSYSKYGMLDRLQKGDIVYEANGGFGFTAHTAVVEGKFYSSTYNQYYIRVIEAIQSGVCRGVLCDTRFSQQQGVVYRTYAAAVTVDNAMSFVVSQIGKPYSINTTRGISASRANWYCSLLAFAAYYNGSNGSINISEESVHLDGSTLITPSMINRKCATYQITVMTA